MENIEYSYAGQRVLAQLSEMQILIHPTILFSCHGHTLAIMCLIVLGWTHQGARGQVLLVLLGQRRAHPDQRQVELVHCQELLQVT